MSANNRNKPKNSASSDSTYTVMDFQREFPDDATCLEYLWRQNLSVDGEHAFCPKCDKRQRFHKVKSRPSWSCDRCGKHLHPTANTIFHKSSTSLQLWFYAIFLMSSTRCGVSAKELERQLGVTYKTAWRMANLIRNQLMPQDDNELSGQVEADETFVGGRVRANEPSGKGIRNDDKPVVFGAIERKGKVYALVIPDRKAPTVLPLVRKKVKQGSVLYTDDYAAYKILRNEGYIHQSINHSKKIYARGPTHTQTIEGFWSMLKNGIRGTHHSVSPKWLQSYVDEFVFRYNNRDQNMFEILLKRSSINIQT